METKEFISFLEKSNFSLAVENGKLILKGDRKKLTNDEINEIRKNDFVINYIKENKNKLIEYVSSYQEFAFDNKSKDISAIYRLSGLQEGMLFFGLYDEKSGAYIEQLSCDLEDPDIKIIEKSWEHILSRHTILRSGFYYDEFNVPVQCVYHKVKLPVTVLDYRNLNSTDQEETIKQFEETDRNQGFDFNTAPLMRIALIRLSDDRYRMIWTWHHILFDGWSMSILMEEFLRTYEMLANGKETEQLEEDRYEDYIRYIERGNKEEQEKYWQEYIKGVEHSTLLPFIKSAAQRKKGAGTYETLNLNIDPGTTTKIESFVQKHRLTINTLMQGVWSYLLHRYTGNNDIVYGVVVSGRPDDLPGVEQRVGMFINTVPLRSKMQMEKKTIEWLKDLQNQQVSSRQFQFTPLQEIQRLTDFKGDLFDSILVFENYPFNEILESKHWSLKVSNMKVRQQTNYPLTIIVGGSEQLNIAFSYNAILWDENYLKELCGHFENVLLQIIANDAGSLSDIELLTKPEVHQLLNKFNEPGINYPKDKTIVDLFEEQVKKTPANIAVIFEDKQLTYRELNEKSNQLAYYLKERGVKTETLVPICIERSMEMIVGILGILKAGGVYVPVDPEYPEDRISYILEDTSASVVVSSDESSLKIHVTENIEIVKIDKDWNRIKKHPKENLKTLVKPGNAAYIIYTSGSTGKPKGVIVEHYNVVRLFMNDSPLFEFTENDVWTMFHSFCFDFSVWEMYGAFFFGGRLVIVPKDVTKDSSQFLELLFSEKVTILNQIPSSFYVLQESLSEKENPLSVRYVIFGGEALDPSKLRQWKKSFPDCKLINMYGITETTVHVTYQEIEWKHIQSGNSIIGRPIPTLNLHVLDSNQKLLPVGIAGELCIGGAGLARGYLNRPELTAEKFIKDNFSDEPGARLYRSGDSGMRLPDGNIEYLGRIDEQVKIRGYRIELGEIESVLNDCELVRHAIVLSKADDQNNKHLIGYVIPEGIFERDAIVKYLKGKLPDYMIPVLWVELESFPLASSGKINKKALPDPDASTLTVNEFIAPRTVEEIGIANIWKEVLNVEQVGINDNFFELGGDSIKVIRVVHKLRKLFKKDIKVFDIYNSNSLSELSQLIENTHSSDTDREKILLDTEEEFLILKKTLLPSLSDSENIEDIYPMTDIQTGMVFASLLNPELSIYHDQFVYELAERIELDVFEKALGLIVKKHSMLRTAFNLDIHSKGVQIVYKQIPVKVTQLETQNLPVQEERNFIKEYLRNERLNPFEINKAPLWRVSLIHSKKHSMSVFQFHHAILDGWSVASFVAEVNNLYLKLLEEPEIESIPKLKSSFKDSVIDAFSEKKNDDNREYWLNEMSEYKRLDIFTQESVIQILKKTYSREFFDTLNRKVIKDGLSVKGLLFGAYVYSLSLLTNEDEVTVGLVTNIRPLKEDSEKVLGCFLNTIPFKSITGHKSLKWKNYFEHIENKLKELKKRDRTTLLDIVKITGEKSSNENPFFDAVFNFVNFHVLENLEKGLSKYEQPETGSEGMIESESQSYQITNTYLDCSAQITGNMLDITFSLRKNLKSGKSLNDLAFYFEKVLECYLENYDGIIDSGEIIPAKEYDQLLSEFNNTETDYARDKTIVDLFEEQATKTPDNTALVFDGKRLTYKELNERSNQIARHLQSKGVKKETLVPVCIERSIEMITGVLGILKAGGAYVPIDPEYPEERIKYMLEDTGASIVLSSKEGRSRLQSVKNIEIIETDTDRQTISKQPTDNLQKAAGPDNLVYVVYTSGSSGKPKGVMIEHGALANLVQWHNLEYEVSSVSRATQMAGVGFDAFGWEVWPYLSTGASVFIIDDSKRLSPPAIMESFISDSITHSFISTALAEELAEASKGKLTSLKYLLTGGDKLSAIDIEGLNYKLINNYGPTENTVVTTNYQTTKENKYTIPLIGKPIHNVKIYIFDKQDQIVPTGVPGEICIGGDSLARGYLNRPDLTAEKFISDPFSELKGARLYRTGDLGRWLADGNIEYLGRIDDQVKIRGYRIELGEIESVLQEYESVRQSVVLTRETGEGGRRLVGYVVSDAGFDKEAVISYLKSKLPDYMVPAIWVEMESFPLTQNGKIDKKALPDPDASELISNEYAAPRNEMEEKLAEIWKDLLHVERVGITDNFFELGGDSIITIQVVSRARRAGYELKPKDIFIHQTISSLSAAVGESTNAAVNGEQGVLTGQCGLLPIQKWYLDGAGKTVSHFNQAVLLSIDKSLTQELLNKAVQQLSLHHDALRFKYQKAEDGQWTQEYEASPAELITVDLRAAKKSMLKSLIKEEADKFQRSLDIEKGEIARFVLIQTSDKEIRNRLLIVIHHLAVDGVSWRIMLDDLELLLNGLQKEGKADLGNKSSSYRQWYEALEQFGKSKNLLTQSTYWEETESSYEPLHVDKSYKGIVTAKDIKTQTIKLNQDQTQLLTQEVPGVYHTEINDILLCALAMTLCEWSSKEKIIIGLEGHGRESISEETDTSRTVGWFTNLYPVLLKLTPDRNLSDTIKSVKEQLRQIPDKGLGYGVLKYINKDEKLSGQECWDIVFNYLGQLDNAVSSGKWFSEAEEPVGKAGDEEREIKEKLSVNGFIKGGEFILNWSYSSRHYKKGTVTELTEKYKSNLESLINHCIEQKKSGAVYTPSDYGLGKDISNAELDKFLDEQYKGKPRRESIEGLYRLSGLQEGMLFHALYDSQTGAYTEQLGCDLIDPDLEIISKSWNRVLSLHSILRSGFYYDEFSIPVQCVYRDVEIPVTYLDYSNMGHDEQATALKDYEEANRLRGFDFKSVPLMRIGLIRLTEDRYRMIWTSHHILFDGWSLPIIMEEFLSTYESLVLGNEPLTKEEDRYEDYIRYMERRDKEQQEKYWRNYMKGVEQGTLLPFIGSTSQRTKGEGTYETLSLEFNPETTASIEHYAHKHYITVNTLMQGVWSYLLHRYTGNDDVVYGIIVSGRPDDLPEVERRVGLYINTMPMHSSFQKKRKTDEWLREIQDQQLSSRVFQYTPIKDIQEWTGVPGDLFDSLLVFENYPVSEILGMKKWSLKAENISMHEQTNYPLTIIVESSERMNVMFNYNASLWEKVYVTEVRDHFENVLQQIIGNEESYLSDIELLTREEELKLLTGFNDNAMNFPKDKTIMDLFEEQADKTPDNIAVEFEDTKLTYRELNERSNQVAHYLRSKGVKENVLVPVCMERSIEMIAGLIGVMKSGASYLPIDPDYPLDLKKYMLEDSQPSLIIADMGFDLWNNTGDGPEVIYVDKNIEISGSHKHNVSRVKNPDQILCVMYTSGSSGKPKGVKITDAGMVNRFYWMWENYPFEKNEKCVLKTSLSFGDHIWEIFGPLNKGVTSVLLRKADILDIDVFAEKLISNKITRLVLVPSLLRTLMNKLITENKIPEHLKYWTCSGEALPYDLIEDFYELFNVNSHKLLNIYGSTEVSADVTCYDTSIDFKNGSKEKGIFSGAKNNTNENKQKNAFIGKPIANCKVYIIDNDINPVPVGIGGEICIGGIPVGKGYLNRPELTEEKFISDPFSDEPGAKIYRTGDIGRWTPAGNIEYMGRKDYQVKIRGFRVELGEIENELNQCDLISEAVVLARDDSEGMKRLVGYVVPKGKFDKKEIVSFLKSKLPDYMVPALWVEMETLPLTPSGKTDKKLLPEVDISAGLTNEYTEPQNEKELRLAEIWKNLLHLERIGTDDNFFELGGHSLLAMRIISSVRKEFGAEIGIKDLFIYPTISLLAAKLSSIGKGSAIPDIEKINDRPERIPLSFSQERLWFVDLLEGSVQYHIPSVIRLKGKPNIEALSFAFQTIVNRHEVLRTVILQDDGEAYQKVMNEDDWSLSIADGSDYKDDALGLKKYIQQIVNAPFDLSKDYMLRVVLVNLSESEHLLVTIMHHIASDGWSVSLIVKEMVELYSSFVEDREAALVQLPIQFADYAIWQRKYLDENLLYKKLSYWKEKLEGVTTLHLATDYSRPAVQSTNGAVAEFRIDKELSDQIMKLGQSQDATLFMTLLTAFKILMYRYSSQEDICVGTPTANRTHQEVEDLIGFFVNLLPLRSNVSAELSFTELLKQVKGNTLEAYEHQEVPFEKVVEAVVKDRDISVSPLFQVMFILQNTPEIPALRLGEVELIPEVFEHNTSKFELTFSLAEVAQGLQGVVEYNTDLYSRETIDRMLVHFKNLLNSAVKAPDQKIAMLPMMNDEEMHQLLFEFNDTTADYPKDKTIIDLFEEQVIKTPDNIAVVFEENQLTYRELNERSNQLAYYLKSKGVSKETLIPICIERSLNMITGILGILKAGGVYVPVDPEYPEERINYILEDTAASIIVSSKESSLKLSESENIDIIKLDEHWPEISLHSADNFPKSIGPHNLAYVIYTSGSTGKPKGVMIEHYNVVRLFKTGSPLFDFTENDVWTMFHSFCFDFSVWEMYGALLFGGRLVIVSKEVTKDASLFGDLLLSEKVTVLNQIPSAFYVLQDIVTEKIKSVPVRYVIFGGEALDPGKLLLWKESYKDCRLINMYGITETTVHVTYQEIENKHIEVGKSIIGKPIPTLSSYILDRNRNLLPVGIAGELYIGGAGLARGYLNRPELTAERFIKDHFSNESSSRLYKTGDTGRWLSDGSMEYFGRTDEQVKIRGYRIELGEIESVLNECTSVRQSIVLAKKDDQNNKRLVGYIVPVGMFDRDDIISYLKGKLPDYMIPAQWIEMESFPLTSSGKINKNVFPDPDASELLRNEYEEPRNQTEEILAEIWKDLLHVERVGIHDNFFELGGDSIITIQAASRARSRGYEIKPKDIFLYQNISSLSSVIAERSEFIVTGEQGLLTGKSGLLPIQQWFFKGEDESVSHFNQSVLLSIDKSVTSESLNLAVEQLTEHHDALRFKYQNKDGCWEQEYGTATGELISIDLESSKESSLGNLIREIADKNQRSLDIEKGDIARFVLIRTPNHEAHNRIFIVIHHLAVDGVSWRILLDDLELLLTGIQKGTKPSLGLKSSSYRQWYDALEQYGHGGNVQSQIRYWEKIVSQYQTLPVDKKFTEVIKSKNISSHIIRLDSDQTKLLLQEVPRSYKTEINDILLCALSLTISKWSSGERIIIGLEGHGRESITEGVDISRTVGWFTNLYPVLLETGAGKDLSNIIKSVKEQLRQIPDKGIGYGVLKYINKEEKLSGKQCWDIVFNYLGQLDNVVKSGKWLSGAKEQDGSAVSDEHTVNELLTVNGLIQEGQLVMNWNYSNLHYEADTIKNLASQYLLNLKLLITHCIDQQKNGAMYTPSDYGLGSEISVDELDIFLNERL